MATSYQQALTASQLEQFKKAAETAGGAKTALANEQGPVLKLGEGFSALYNTPVIGREAGPEGGTPIYGDTVIGGFSKDLGNNQYAIYTPSGQFSHTYTVDPNESLKGIGTVLAMPLIATGLQNLAAGNGLFGQAAGNGAFLGEGVASGVPAWDMAYGDALLSGMTPAATAGTGLLSGISSYLSNPANLASLAKLGIGAAALGAGSSKGTVYGQGNPDVGSLPVVGLPQMTPEYYKTVQNYYNAYLPNTNPNVGSYLANWYGYGTGIDTPALDMAQQTTKPTTLFSVLPKTTQAVNLNPPRPTIPGFDTILNQYRPTTPGAAQTYQEKVANLVLGGDVSAASSPKAEQVKQLYASIGRTGNLAPSTAEIAFWASQPETGTALQQRFLDSASTFVGDPVYNTQGQTAAGMLSSLIAANPASTASVNTVQTANNPLESIRQAFLSIPGANPNPDESALRYYAEQGVDKLKSDVAFIRAADPVLAAQIDAERAAAGLK